MKNWKNHVAIAVVCFVLGFVIVLQIRSVKINKPPVVDNTEAQRAELLTAELASEKEKNANLTASLYQTKQELSDLQKGITGKDEATAKIQQEYEQMAEKAGYTNVTGEGVTVTLTDKPTPEGGNANIGIVHDQDVLKVVNELWAAGAKAIDINGERLIATSEIRCVGNTICVNRNVYASPFVITAIGDAETLESGLTIPGGAVDSLSYYINIKVEKNDNLSVLGYKEK